MGTTRYDHLHAINSTGSEQFVVLRIKYLANGENGCVYSLDLVIRNKEIRALAKTDNVDRNARRQDPELVKEFDKEIDHEIDGLKRVGQWIEDFESDGRRWIIMIRQPGVPTTKAEGWLRYVNSEGKLKRDASKYPRGPCVNYVERLRASVGKDVDDMIRNGVVHTDLHPGNVLLQEQWVNTDPRSVQRGLKPQLISVTANSIDWGFWDEIPVISQKLKDWGYWDYSSKQPLK
ncbi:hypothetical protein FRC02_005493 [Tulasnella sp. 418]|nr:hypothetical protein FRC02_005493 [Tulasnella sp. 418]